MTNCISVVFLHLQCQQQRTESLFWFEFLPLWPNSSALSFELLRTCGYIDATWITQGNDPISRSFNFSYICKAPFAMQDNHRLQELGCGHLWGVLLLTTHLNFLNQGMTNPNPTPQMGFKKLPPLEQTNTFVHQHKCTPTCTFWRDSNSEPKVVPFFSALCLLCTYLVGLILEYRHWVLVTIVFHTVLCIGSNVNCFKGMLPMGLCSCRKMRFTMQDC